MSRRPELTSAPSAGDVRTVSPAGFRIVEDGVGMPEPVIGYGSVEGHGQQGRPQIHGTTTNARSDSDNIQEEEDAANERSSLIKKGRSSTKPWYRRANPWFIHLHMFMLGMGMALLAGPKIELFNKAICQQINEEAVMSHPDMPILLLTPEQCRHSIPVQQRLAELNLLLQVIMGVSCMLTTPFWAALSDRIGRKPVIALNAASFVAGDLILVIVLSNPGKIPYLWLLTYPALEGLVAGMAGGQSVMAAYIGDCTEHGSRAGVFARLMAVVFIGIAVAPAISSFLIQKTGNLLVPFYVCLALHAAQTLYASIILPESLGKVKQLEARQLRTERKKKAAEKAEEDVRAAELRGDSWIKTQWVRAKKAARPLTAIFSPIALLGPRPKPAGGLDWSLPMVALASAFYYMIMSIYSLKMQYAQLKFGWTAVELGNLLSLMGVTRIVALLAIIPLVSKLVRKPHSEPVRDGPASPADTEATLATPGTPSASTFSKVQDEEWNKHKADSRLIHDYKFDLHLARFSIVIDTSCYVALTMTQTATYFCVFVVAQALGSGANPALSSLALMFADPNETGKLMGALAVSQVLASSVIAPVLFGSVYAATVSTWPEAIFAVGASIYFLALITLLFVRVRRPKWTGYSSSNVEDPNASDPSTSSL